MSPGPCQTPGMVRPPSCRTESRRAGRSAVVIGLAAVLAPVLGACASSPRPELVVPTTTAAPSITAGASQDPDPACTAVAVGSQEIPVFGGGVDHLVQIQIPKTFRGARSATVIDFHGLGSTGAEQAVLSGYPALADEKGFIVVHPTGVPSGGDARAGWQLTTSPPDDTHDDIAFVGALIDELVANWCADEGRIYVTGMSNGGFFASRLVCEMADRIAAAVSVAGLNHPDTCAPTRSVPFAAFHGTADDFVPFNGNGQTVLGDPANLPVELFTSNIPAEFAEFAAAAGCSPDPIDTPFGTTAVRHSYEGCAGGATYAFVELIGGGHVWPRATDWPLDATIDGWAFMSQFAI